VYLHSITFTNVKLMRKVELKFADAEDEVRLWTVLIGENGTCKTTILQAIALAASGHVGANQLIEGGVPLTDLRGNGHAKRSAEVFATFSVPVPPRGAQAVAIPPGAGPWVQSHITARPGSSQLECSSNYIDNPADATPLGDKDPVAAARQFNLGGWLVAGYGVVRDLPLPASARQTTNEAIDRVAPLFGRGSLVATDHATQLPEGWRAAYKSILKSLFTGNEGLAPHVAGVELRGQGGLAEAQRFGFKAGTGTVKVPATYLSQGYQSTIAWIADLVGRMFKDNDRPINPEDMRGVVLVDEIDLHLHPAWQLKIARALKTAFPQVQFIATTHSPLVLPGLEPNEIIGLRWDEDGHVVSVPFDADPAFMTGTQIYRRFFGVENTYLTEAAQLLQKYNYLASNALRSNEEDADLQTVRQQLAALSALPDWEPVERESRT
jgi:predicted ATPase